jgi:4-coumarate--CoA ligase
MWAIIRAGGCVNGASPAYNVEEMSHALKTAGTRFLLTLPGSIEAAVEACKAVGSGFIHRLTTDQIADT